MSGATTIGHTTSGTCMGGCKHCPHGRTGTNASGSPNVLINGSPAHRVGDTGTVVCPHGGSFKSTVGSPIVLVNGSPLTRIGDATVCVRCGQPGTHVSGCPNVIVA